MKRLRRILQRSAERLLLSGGFELRRAGVGDYPDASERQLNLIRKYRPYTMTSDLRQWALLKAVDYIDSASLQGDIVECGVWRGGAMMTVKEYRMDRHEVRRLFLFDTFAGMTSPTEVDKSMNGLDAATLHRKQQGAGYNAWAYASLEEVTSNFAKYGLLDDKVIFRKGRVEETLLAGDLPNQIALLRLDTDWYESSRIELEVLYPRLVRGGIIIIDDYGTWRGATKATDEYFETRPILLTAIDRGCRIGVKV